MYTKESAKEMRLNNCEYAEKFQVFYDFVTNHYEFRVNSLTQETEFRLLYSKDDFQRLDQMSLNTILLNCKRAGSKLTDSDMKKYLLSEMVNTYDPVRSYMENLPQWNGRDTLTDVVGRLTDKPFLQNAMRRWFLGMAAQMIGIDMVCANSSVPVLVSTRQGLRKSTFCRSLLPEPLKKLYAEQIDVSERGHFQELMATTVLINLDECDRLLTEKNEAKMKNVLTATDLTYRKLYTNIHERPRRLASFIGTSNQTQILTDPTGSRRYIIIEIDREIDCSPIDHDQLYAQLKAMLLSGERPYMTRDEEAEVEENNKQYYQVCHELEVFYRVFRAPKEGEEYETMLSSEIVNVLKMRYHDEAKDIKPEKLARKLGGNGFEYDHKKEGHRYHVTYIQE